MTGSPDRIQVPTRGSRRLVDEACRRDGTGVSIEVRPTGAFIDPFPLAAEIAQRTSRARIIVDVHTGAWHPYLVARRLSTLDKIAAGRIAWRPLDDDRDRAAESVHIVDALLTSWRPGAVVNDRESGLHIDTDLVDTVNFEGRWYRVDSPLDTPPGPQGRIPLAEGGAR